MSEEKKVKLTVNKPSTQMLGQPISVSGIAQPGEKVSVKGEWKGEENMHHPATAGPDGRWGATLIAPNEGGVYQVSVSSTDATTSTTFPVRDPKQKKP